MKVKDLIARLQELDPGAELWFTSCCYPTTKHFEIKREYDQPGDNLVIDGYRGSYVAGDPDSIDGDLNFVG